MSDLINISFGDAALTALLGYLVVFFGLVLLMVVVIIMGKIMVSRANKSKAAAPAAPAESAAPAPCRSRLGRRAEAL
jgi:Na+-transporting methylmalonyl-CoA/oxaloacetate decarboxylase gamma subunit